MIAVRRPGSTDTLTESSATTRVSPAPYTFVSCSALAAGAGGVALWSSGMGQTLGGALGPARQGLPRS